MTTTLLSNCSWNTRSSAPVESVEASGLSSSLSVPCSPKIGIAAIGALSVPSMRIMKKWSSLLVAAGQHVVVAAAIVVDLVRRIEVAVVEHAELRGAASRERFARGALERREEAVVDELAHLARAELERTVPGELRPRRVRVRRGDDDLARELGAEALLEIVRPCPRRRRSRPS